MKQATQKKWMALGFAGLALAAMSAGAEAQTVGDVATNVLNGLAGVKDVLSGAAYLTGAVFSIKALMAFRDQAEDGGRTKLSRPIALLIVGTILLGLPGFIHVTTASLFGGDGSAGTLVDHS